MSQTRSHANTCRMLLLGPLPPPLGGATVLFQHLARELANRRDCDTRVINTAGLRAGTLTGLWRAIRVVLRTLHQARKAEVIGVHASISGMPILGLVSVVLAKVTCRPLILRIIGGLGYHELGYIRRRLMRWSIRHARLCLVETKGLARAAKDDGLDNVAWFPNSRQGDLFAGYAPREGPCRRFVYLGQVRPEKGIRELVEAAEGLDEDVVVDIWGPILYGFTEQEFELLHRVRYRGVLEPDEIGDALRSYDSLVLPTYWRSEGYPGVILEAYAAGLPVISTDWRWIPEIVDNTCGMLVPPGDVNALRSALQALAGDAGLYAKLVKGVVCKREMFDATFWARRYMDYCRALSKGSAICRDLND